jgi:hypothetical protein
MFGPRAATLGYMTGSGRGSPSKESTIHTLRCVSPSSLQVAWAKMHTPPRHTPASKKSPSTLEATVSCNAYCVFPRRLRPTMVCARPETRVRDAHHKNKDEQAWHENMGSHSQGCTGVEGDNSTYWATPRQTLFPKDRRQTCPWSV